MSAHPAGGTFPERAQAALGDAQLREALRRATGTFADRRRAAMATTPDWEELRERARAIKDETLARLDGYLDEFTANAERAGARVVRARDGDEARRAVVEIARRRGAATVVKSKSMATEEIGLNAALEAAGLTVVETDLGEWIIQLAGEAPSHIVAPAVHKTRQQVAELFARTVETPASDEVSVLTALARRNLRARFAAADLGVSGVNVAVAETGSIFVLENEGNARLVTSLPRTHVAVMGIEKLVPRLADLDVLQRVLPRAATGQRVTTYQSLLTGPAGPGREGPDELHIVLLDNGRARIAGEPETREVLACLRCGACLNVCPVYRQIGGHAYGSVYPGPIGAVITPLLEGLHAAAPLPFASTLCGACRDACPVKIDLPRLLLELRSRVVEADVAEGGRPRPRGDGLTFRAWAAVMTRPRLYRTLARLGRLAQPLVVRDGRIGDGALLGLAPPLRNWTSGRDLRPLARRSFRDLWRDGLGQETSAGREAGRPVRPAVQPWQAAAPARPASDASGLVDRFRHALSAVGGHVHVARDEDGAASVLRTIVASSGVRRAVVSDEPLARRLARAAAGPAWLDDPAREDLFGCDMGLTSAQWAIAETGTLVLDNSRERHRLASLVPPVHVAVVPQSRLRDSMADVLAELGAGRGLPAAVSFVTGPSRTGDIEMTLTLGVHGPGTLHVVLVEGA